MGDLVLRWVIRHLMKTRLPKSSDVYMQSHLEVLEIQDLQGKIQSPPPSIVMMLL